MTKNVIKLNETTLRKIVAESVKKLLKEAYEMPDDEFDNDDEMDDAEDEGPRYNDNGYLTKANYQSPIFDDINQKLQGAIGKGDAWAIVNRTMSDTSGRNIVISSNNKNTLSQVTSVMAGMGYKYLNASEATTNFTPDNVNKSLHKTGGVSGRKSELPGMKQAVVDFSFVKRSK